jgi:hypothetical protein
MIKFLDLQKINLAHLEEIEEKVLQTFRSGWYLLGNEMMTKKKTDLVILRINEYA